LAVIKYNRVSNLIGKGFSCRENRYRIVADLTRVKKKYVAITLLQ